MSTGFLAQSLGDNGAHQEQEKDHEENLENSHMVSRNATNTEDSGGDGENEEKERPRKHGGVFLLMTDAIHSQKQCQGSLPNLSHCKQATDTRPVR